MARFEPVAFGPLAPRATRQPATAPEQPSTNVLHNLCRYIDEQVFQRLTLEYDMAIQLKVLPETL